MVIIVEIDTFAAFSKKKIKLSSRYFFLKLEEISVKFISMVLFPCIKKIIKIYRRFFFEALKIRHRIQKTGVSSRKSKRWQPRWQSRRHWEERVGTTLDAQHDEKTKRTIKDPILGQIFITVN